jgi:hypothetical protein
MSDASFGAIGMTDDFGSPAALLAIIASFLISGLLILAAGWLLIRTAHRFIGEKYSGSLTVVITITGALIAVFQFNLSVADKKEERARALAFAKLLTSRTLNLASRSGLQPGQIDDPYVLTPQILAERIERLKAIGAVFEKLDLKDLPSADAMAAVVKARSGTQTIVTLAQKGIDQNSSIDLNSGVGEVATAIEKLNVVRDRLYPVYRLGNINLTLGSTSNVERR